MNIFSQIKKITFFLSFLLLVLFILLFFSIPQNKVISQNIQCNPDSLSNKNLSFGNENDNIKNFNACLALLGFYFGKISNKYDENTVAALKRFYLNIRKYDPLEQGDIINARSRNFGNFSEDLNLIKNMAEFKIKLMNPKNLTSTKSFNLDSDYSSLDKLVVDENFNNILVSYRAKNNKYYVKKINISGKDSEEKSRFFDNIRSLNFIDTKGNYYINYTLKNNNYLTTNLSNTPYGPFEDIGDFYFYTHSNSSSPEVGIFYLKNRFIYAQFVGIYNMIYNMRENFGPFTNAFGFKLSPYEPKIAIISSDPQALEKVGKPVGYYVLLQSKNSSTIISGFSSIQNFDFAEEDIPGIDYGGFIFTYKPLWPNITTTNINNFLQEMEKYLKDWLYIEGEKSPCKDFQKINGLLNKSSQDHTRLLQKLGIFSISCRDHQIVSGTNPVINKEYLERVMNNNWDDNLLMLNKKIEGPLSICGPYNVVYDVVLSPDRRKLVITYAKDYINEKGVEEIKKGIAGVNLTKMLDLASTTPDCPQYCDQNKINISSLIKNCYPDLAKLVYAQSVGQMDFYNSLDFDQSLGVIFSKDSTRLAFFYRISDRYHLKIFDFPTPSLASEIKPIFYKGDFISPIENFKFSPNGRIFAFLGEKEDLNEKFKNFYVVYIDVYRDNRDNFTQGKEVKEISIPNIRNLKNITFSTIGNHIAFQYSYATDTNNYIKIYSFGTQPIQEKDLGPFSQNLDIQEILFTGDGNKFAIILYNRDNRKYYLYYNDNIYDIGIRGKIKFNQVINQSISDKSNFDYELLIVYVKEELEGKNRVAKVYFSKL